MAILLISIIYITFISLGLPDGLLGAAWPIMHLDLHAAVAVAGVISFIITCGTIASSLLSDRLTRRFGVGRVIVCSVALTAGAMLGFSGANATWQLFLLAVPYGLGAGAIDAALNNVVALHYSAKHMSWLHCFWGVGASIGPYIMGHFLSGPYTWQSGYRTVGIIQTVLVCALLFALPLFKRVSSPTIDDNNAVDSAPPIKLRDALKIPGVKAVLIAFFAYCSAEMTAMLWTSSYLTMYRGVDEQLAATLASLFYLGMMGGRFVNGFLAERFSDKVLIRVGIGIISCGVLLLLIPTTATLPAIIGVLIVGLGCAPVYPCIIHATPIYFGRDYSQVIIGVEMASAYTGSCLMPPVFGLLGEHISMGIFPVFIALFILILSVMTERVNRTNRLRNIS